MLFDAYAGPSKKILKGYSLHPPPTFINGEPPILLHGMGLVLNWILKDFLVRISHDSTELRKQRNRLVPLSL